MSETQVNNKHTFKRALYIVLGCIAVILGSIGVVVPGLPTTPLVLLASWCFYKSSPRLQIWLMRSFLGKYIQEYKAKGIDYVICTDIAKDGMLQGTSNELYAEILAAANVKLIASGGVASIDDLIKVKELGCEGAILGKAIYEGRIDLKVLSRML